MRWNVVIGGQLFSKSFLGYTTYKMGFVTRRLANGNHADDSSLYISLDLVKAPAAMAEKTLFAKAASAP